MEKAELIKQLKTEGATHVKIVNDSFYIVYRPSNYENEWTMKNIADYENNGNWEVCCDWYVMFGWTLPDDAIGLKNFPFSPIDRS